MGELQDKVVLITGASRGIGKAIAEVCAREGAQVIASGIEPALTEALVQSFPGGAKRHLSLALDVTRPDARAAAMDQILSRYQRLDGLVNNAGIDFARPFLQTSPEDWHRVMAVDLEAVFALCQLAIRQFLTQGGGAIVNISSVHTLATYPGSGPYAAAKGGINLLTKSLTCEFASKGIRVNALAPGLVKTDIWQAHINAHGSEAAAYAYWRKNIPSGEVIDPREVGEMASFLLSDRTRNLNGAVIYLDGGLTSQLIASE